MNQWWLPVAYNGLPAERMSKARRLGITFYFVRALYCYFDGADASAAAYLEKAIRML